MARPSTAYPAGLAASSALIGLVAGAWMADLAQAAPPSPEPPAPFRGTVVLTGRSLDPESSLLAVIGQRRGEQTTLTKKDEERLVRHLGALGYKTRISRKGKRLILDLTPRRVIRKIYIKGNWPIFEDEILRRLRFRPGQYLPEGRDLALAIASQEERLKLFLSREGYFDGSLRIQVVPTDTPHEVNLKVRVIKGRRYKVGSVEVHSVGTAMAPRPADATAQTATGEPPLALPRKSIADMFRQKLWFYKRAFSTERFKEDVKALTKKFHELGFPGVRIRESFVVDRRRSPDEAVRISLRIQQRKRIIIRYEGNDNLSKDELDETLTLYEEGTYDDYELGQSVRQIHRLCQSKGFLQARVHFTRQVGRLSDQVTFHIQEGPRFRVREILFSGNRSIPTGELRKVIKTRTFPCLGYVGLGAGGYITDLQLEQDEERLEAHYREQGFSDVRVQGELAPHPELLGRAGALAAALGSGVAEEGDLYLRFNIVERDRLVVEQVVIHGNRAIDDRTLLSQLALRPGQPATEKALALDKARLVRIYSERGHPYASVLSMEELSTDGRRVTVQLRVVEEKQVRFGPIFLRGNFQTRRSAIMADIDIKPGDPFDIRKIEQAERRLRKLELFNVVRIQPLGMSDSLAVVPVLVQVEERYDDWGDLEFAVGGSTDNKLFGAVAYNNYNLLGFGTRLTLKAEYGMEIQSGNVHYKDPRLLRLLDYAVALDLLGYLRNQDTERLGEILTFGGSISLSQELVPDLKGMVHYDIRAVKHREDIHRPAGVDEASRVDVITRVAGLGLTLAYDKRDNMLSPTRGFRLSSSVFWASTWLGGSDHFFRFNTSFQGFIPLPKDITIAGNIRFDYGIPLGETFLLPKVERFYAGGDTTIRGLEEDMAWTEKIPYAYTPTGETAYHLRPQGGNIRLLTNLELQFPLWKESIIFGFPLMGAVFTDNGVVTNSFSDFEWSRFRHGVGAALRILTPVGFASFEYAFCLDPGLGDSRTGRFHANFGYIF